MSREDMVAKVREAIVADFKRQNCGYFVDDVEDAEDDPVTAWTAIDGHGWNLYEVASAALDAVADAIGPPF